MKSYRVFYWKKNDECSATIGITIVKAYSLYDVRAEFNKEHGRMPIIRVEEVKR